MQLCRASLTLLFLVSSYGQDFPALKTRSPWRPDASLRKQNVDWRALLANSEIRFLTDNQFSLSLDSNPGIARFHYYPVRKKAELVGKLDYEKLAKQTRFEGEGAKISFRDGSGKLLVLRETNYRWSPERVERFWEGNGSKLREEIAVQGNVTVERLTRIEGPALDINIQGSFPYAFAVTNVQGQPVFRFEDGISIAPGIAGATKAEPIANGYQLRATLRTTLDFVAATGYLPEQVAAEEAQAIKAPSIVFNRAHETWDYYFRGMVPQLVTANSALDRLYYYLFYVVRSSLFDIPWEPYQRPYTCPWKTGAIWQWSWNTPMNAVAERWLNDSSMSKSGIDLIAENNGALYFGTYLHPYSRVTPAHNIFDWYREVDEAQKKVDESKTYDFLSVMPYTVPNAFVGIREVYRMTADRSFLRENLPLMANYEKDARRRADPNSLITPFQMMVDEFDYSLRWKPVQKTFAKKGLQRAFDVPVEMADVNSYLYVLRRFLQQAYTDLNEPKAAVEMRDLADRTSAEINGRLWDSKRNFYCDARSDTHGSTQVRAISGFAPFYAGIVPVDRRAALISSLEDPQGFGSPFPFPSIELNNPDIDPTLLTFGGDSLITTGVWTLVNALVQNGEGEKASRYLGRVVQMMTKDGVSSSYSYNSLTGQPNQKKHQLSTQSAIVNDLVARYVVGLTPREDETFEFNPVAVSLAKGRLKFGPFRYHDRYWIQVDLAQDSWSVSVDSSTMTFKSPRHILLKRDNAGSLHMIKE